MHRLCYLFCRCTRSISVCPPARYAHLAAFRGRIMCKGIDDSSSSASGAGGRSVHFMPVRSAIAVSLHA